MNLKKSIANLTRIEKCIWIGSLSIIFLSSVLSPTADWLSVLTSLIGATALIFVGKGDPLGQLVTIFFGILYAAVSWGFHYYGEMITYLGMTAPSALWALITWLRHPYAECEVKVAALQPRSWLLLLSGAVLVTSLMFFVLRFFGTANLMVSTLSVTTSFLASMLTVLRSPYYALFYAANDIVLIVLWVLASLSDAGYLPMVLCFVVFLVNDLYGFVNWRRMRTQQSTV